MSSRRQQIENVAGEISRPILGELGLELVDIEFTRRGREQVLCLYVDRPGGVNVEEIQNASRAVEKSLEVAEVISERYLLEVSSPGIGRPWKSLRDFEKNINSRVNLKIFRPLPDGRRHIRGKVAGVEGENILITSDEGQRFTIPFTQISSAKPEVDWNQLLKGTAKPAPAVPPARRTP